jgi:hypothetical protein
MPVIFTLTAPRLVPAGEVEGFPVGAAEADIGRGGIAVDDVAESLALRIEDVDSGYKTRTSSRATDTGYVLAAIAE